jgi:hypothetical protein
MPNTAPPKTKAKTIKLIAVEPTIHLYQIQFSSKQLPSPVLRQPATPFQVRRFI